MENHKDKAESEAKQDNDETHLLAVDARSGHAALHKWAARNLIRQIMKTAHTTNEHTTIATIVRLRTSMKCELRAS